MVSEDRVLVEMLKAGDENALEQLIMRWRPAAEAYARNCLQYGLCGPAWIRTGLFRHIFIRL